MIIEPPVTNELQSSIMLDLLPLGAMVINSDLRILEWNRTLSEWTGISRSFAVGTRLTDLFPNVSDSRYLNRLKGVFDSGLPVTYSAAFHKHFLRVPARHSLAHKWMIQQTEVRSLSSRNDQAMITIQDVSFQYDQLERLRRDQLELRQTRDELARSNEALVERNAELDDFAKVASHDLQEPLRSISNLANFLEEDCYDQLGETGRGYLGKMTETTKRMRDLIRDILLLSRCGSEVVRDTPLKLNDVVDDALDFLRVAISDRNAEVTVPKLPAIHGDRRLISQLFQNLIGNALKFVKDKNPVVEITIGEDEGDWVLGVKDNGIGIEQIYAQKVFEPFQRLHSRTQYAGTGIGLSICRKAVVRHGGRIWLESQIGQGSHFKFTIPKDKPDGSDQDKQCLI